MKKLLALTFLLTGLATAQSDEVMQYVRTHHTIGKPEMVELAKLCFQDGKFDEKEQRLLKDFSLGPGEVSLSNEPGTYTHVNSEAAHLAQLLTQRKSVSELSQKGHLQDLVDVWIIESTDEAREKFTGDMAKVLDGLWNQSNPGNGYGPIRDQLGKWAQQMPNLATPEQRAAAADMIYRGAKQLDENLGGVVPDGIYDYLDKLRTNKN